MASSDHSAPFLVKVLLLSSYSSCALGDRDGQYGSIIKEIHVDKSGKTKKHRHNWPPQPLSKQELLQRLNEPPMETKSKSAEGVPLHEIPEKSRWPHFQAGASVPQQFCNINSKIDGQASYIKAIYELRNCMDDLKYYRQMTRLWGKRSTLDNAVYWEHYKTMVKMLNEVELAYPLEESFEKDQRATVRSLKDGLRDTAAQLSRLREGDTVSMSRLAMEGAPEGYIGMWEAPAPSMFEVDTHDNGRTPIGWWIAQNGRLMNTTENDVPFAKHGVGSESVAGAGWVDNPNELPSRQPPATDYREESQKKHAGKMSKWSTAENIEPDPEPPHAVISEEAETASEHYGAESQEELVHDYETLDALEQEEDEDRPEHQFHYDNDHGGEVPYSDQNQAGNLSQVAHGTEPEP